MDAKSDEASLVEACLNQRPFAWQRFVDQYLPLVLQTVQEISDQTHQGWSENHCHDLTRNLFEQIMSDSFQLLREWDSATDFQTFLIIATRRIALTDTDSNQDDQ